jgi:hypothetical protein
MDTRSEVDTDLFLLLEHEIEEPTCEADHTPTNRAWGPQVRECTLKAVAYKSVSCAGIAFAICANSLKFNEELIEWGMHCPQCFRFVGDCWSFLPIRA